MSTKIQFLLAIRVRRTGLTAFLLCRHYHVTQVTVKKIWWEHSYVYYRMLRSILSSSYISIFTMINAQKGAIYFVSLYHLPLQEQIDHFGTWNFCFQVVLVFLVGFFHYMFWSGNQCEIKLYLLLTMIIWNSRRIISKL